VENSDPVALPVHVIPSVDVAIVVLAVFPPVATNVLPFHATPEPATENSDVVALPVHVIPSNEVIIIFPVP
jgi:hypothetical protein